jgi:hypothetical protein
MSVSRFSRSIIMAAGLVIPASVAAAQDRPISGSTARQAIEVMPFVSIGSNGSLPVGGAISFPITSNVRIETEVGFRRADGRLNFLSISGNVLCALPQVGRMTPYVAAGAGLGQYGAAVVAQDGSLLGTERKAGLFINAGGGLKVPVDDTWGMRTDARWFKSFGRHGSEQWRVSQGISFDVGKR